jgi:hypothetical protein
VVCPYSILKRTNGGFGAQPDAQLSYTAPIAIPWAPCPAPNHACPLARPTRAATPPQVREATLRQAKVTRKVTHPRRKATPKVTPLPRKATLSPRKATHFTLKATLSGPTAPLSPLDRVNRVNRVNLSPCARNPKAPGCRSSAR